MRTNGDPETVLFPSKGYVHRNENLDELYRTQILPSIPVTPISYSDAMKVFELLGGTEAPVSFKFFCEKKNMLHKLFSLNYHV